MYVFCESGANNPGSAKPTPCRVSATLEILRATPASSKPRERLFEPDERPLNDGCVKRE
jgi:hypothetical protein